MLKILIDTNVILDVLLNRQPFTEDSAKVLALCDAGKVQGFLTPVIISDCYYLLRQTANHTTVIEKLRQLLTFLDVVVMDKNTILSALNSDFSDFEDALQNFAAVRHGRITAIVTRNVKDFKKSDIGVMTPEGFLKGIVSENF